MERIDKTHANGFPGIWIPIEILMHPALTLLEKMLFGMIANLSATRKGCWASNRYLSAWMSVTPQTISKSISNLIKFNFITAEYAIIQTLKKGIKQVRTIRIDPQYTYLYKGMLDNVFESLEQNVYTLKDNLKGYENPLGGIKENLNSPLLKSLSNSSINHSIEEKNIYKKNPISSDKDISVPKNSEKSPTTKKRTNERIPFRETLQMFPEEFRENNEFKTAYRAWWCKRNDEGLKPLTLAKIKTSVSIFKNHFTVEEAIARLEDAEDKVWFTCVFKDDRGLIKGEHYIRKNRNGKAKKLPPAEQPEPTKYAEPIIDFLEQFNPEPDVRLINQEVKKGEEYLEALYWKQAAASKKAYKEKDSDQIQWTREWCEGLPGLEDLIRRYIENLQTWAKDPSENLFKWDCETFKKFRFHLQKNIFMRNWETGHRIS